jgi:hypothetical protein
MRSLISTAVFAAVLAALLIFGWYVWPTPWRTQVLRSDGTDSVYRIHRTEGRIEVLTRSGWKPLKPHDPYAGLSSTGRKALGLNN